MSGRSELRGASPVVGLAAVAVSFAICGFFSAALYADKGFAANALGVPFAALWLVLMARKRSGPLAAAVIACIWPVARFAAVWAHLAISSEHPEYVALCVAGLIGGWGVAVASGIACPRVLSWGRQSGAAAVGVIAALPFQPWITEYVATLNTVADPAQPARLRFAFAIWQAAMGSYLFVTSREVRVLDSWRSPVASNS